MEFQKFCGDERMNAQPCNGGFRTRQPEAQPCKGICHGGRRRPVSESRRRHADVKSDRSQLKAKSD